MFTALRGLALPTRPPVMALAARMFKVRASVKKMCDACYIVKRSGRVYNLCTRDPKVHARARGNVDRTRARSAAGARSTDAPSRAVPFPIDPRVRSAA